MKPFNSIFSGSAVGLALCLSYAAASARPAAPKKPASPNPAPVPVVAEVEMPKSVFVIPATPREGRNPFFPRSNLGIQGAKITPSAIDTSVFVLNGITSPPKRTAMINGRTFEPGEQGEVRLPSGARVLIKCIEVKTDSAVIIVGGQRRELRMRSNY